LRDPHEQAMIINTRIKAAKTSHALLLGFMFFSIQPYITGIPRRNHFAINFAQTGRKLWLNHLKCSIVFAISQ